MNMLKKVLILFISISSLLPFSQKSVDVVHADSNDVYEGTVASVKEAINKLIEAKNYTVEVTTKKGPIDVQYNLYYTENGFYDDFLGDEYGYVAVDEGVFRFDLYNREFTASKLLKDDNNNNLTSVWDNNLFYGFHKLRSNEFTTANGKEFSSAEKRVKNMFLNMFHVDFGKYQYVNPVEFKVDNDINTFEFSFSLSTGERYDGKIKNFNCTKIDVVDKYLSEENSYHQNDDKLQTIIDLFANYNYTRIIYGDDVDDYSVIAGKECYDEKYFYTFFEDKYIAAGLGYEIGMVGIEKEYGPISANGKEYGPYKFSGSYYCYIVNDENGNEVLNVMTSFPINTDSFVPNVYNYPTFLNLFDNSQYLDAAGGSDYQFYTSKLSCVEDFINNFQMGDTITNLGAVPTGVFVEYYPNGTPDFAGTENKETVIFRLEVSYYGAITTIPFVYTDFNKTKVDLITQENIDKIINDAIQNIIDRDTEVIE